jgi:hypothetical protein
MFSNSKSSPKPFATSSKDQSPLIF